MKYLLPVVLLLALAACERQSSDPQEAYAEAPPVDIMEGDESPQFLAQPLQGKVSQRGLYRMVRSSGVVDDSDTNTGKVISKPVIQLVESTDRIPLIKGAQMYLQYRIWPFPNQPAYVDLNRVLKHPEMKLPDGSVTSGSEFEIKRRVSSNHVIVYTGYGFDEEYELVEGDWVFEIWYEDKKLIEQTFTTYWPDKEEIATLKSVLEMGNNVLTKMQSPDNPDVSKNWPRVMVGEDVDNVPAGVEEVFADPSRTSMAP